MKKVILKNCLIVCFLLFGSNESLAKRQYYSKINLELPSLKKYLDHKILISSVQKENNKKKKIEEIKKIDKKWKNSVGVPDYIKIYLTNDCAKYLLQLKQKKSYLAEVFVMDNQGAIVCESNKTSDYWQGDEEKWINSFNQGNGKVFIGKPGFDESTKAFLIQVSIPVFDDQKKTIGVVTLGIDLDKL